MFVALFSAVGNYVHKVSLFAKLRNPHVPSPPLFLSPFLKQNHTHETDVYLARDETTFSKKTTK